MISSVLVVAAHPDDEVLGCGGTISKLSREGNQVHVLILADGETSRGATISSSLRLKIDKRNTAAENARTILGYASLKITAFPDNQMDTVSLLGIAKVIEESIALIKPETVFTHHHGDVNVDHRITHEAVLAACRPQPGNPVKNLLFFEIPSSTEWRPPSPGYSFNPNSFFNIADTLAIKADALNAYKEEMRPFPHARSIDAVVALAKWRGATVGFAAAEAFIVGRQMVS